MTNLSKASEYYIRKIKRPHDLLKLDPKLLQEYLLKRLTYSQSSDMEISPPLNIRIEEQLEDIFIQALYLKDEESKLEQKNEYREHITEIVSSLIEEELKGKWQKYYQDPKNRNMSPEESPLCKIKKEEPHSYRLIIQLIHIAEALGNESPGLAIFNALGEYLFPPQTLNPLPIEIHLLGLVALVDDITVGSWWKMWIDAMELKIDNGNKLQNIIVRSCRARFPMVIFGLITTQPSLAIRYFVRALKAILLRGEVKTDPKIFIRNVIQGLISLSPQMHSDLLLRLANEISLSSNEIFHFTKKTLRAIKFRDREVNGKISKIISKMQEDRCRLCLGTLLSLNLKSLLEDIKHKKLKRINVVIEFPSTMNHDQECSLSQDCPLSYLKGHAQLEFDELLLVKGDQRRQFLKIV